MVLYRFVLPIALFTASLSRPSFISIPYIIFALIGPLLGSLLPSTPIQRMFRVYLLSLLLTTCLTSVVQLSYQIYESFFQPDIDEYTRTCNISVLNFWLRQIGLIRIRRYSGFDTIRVVFPELLALATSVVATVYCLLIHQNNDSRNDRCTANVQAVRKSSSIVASGEVSITETMILSLQKLSDVAIIFTVGLVGIFQPCILSSVYFIAFLFIATWWALYKPLQRHIFNTIKRLIIYYCALHFLLLYIYQIPFFQNIIPGQSLFARLVGFVPILYTDCNAWWSLNVISLDYWTAFANVVAVPILYHLLIMQYNFTRYGIYREYKACEDTESSMRDELLASDINSHNLGNLTLHQANPYHADHQGPGTCATDIFQEFSASLTFIFSHLHIFSLIVVTFWAFLYHSIFGFVLLVEVFIILVVKNTRAMAFQASPPLMAYVEFLLIAQYICSMDVKHELPQSSYLELIGFIFAADRTAAFITLLTKGLLSLPLFALLRLYLREKCNHSARVDEQDQICGIYAIAGFIGISGYDTALFQSALMGVRVVAKYWVFVVSLVLLIIPVYSPPVLYTVGFFVSFSVLIILLLSSFGCLWRLLYSYFSFLTIYTSVVIIVLYCYQFPSISLIWQKATGLSDAWNHDIGLVNYKQEGDKRTLLIHLIGPISLFLVTMLYLKFFYDLWCPFISTVSNAAVTDTDGETSNEQQSFYAKVKHIAECVREALWNIAEAHVAKLVMFILVIVAVNDICALNLALIILTSISVCIPTISSTVSLLLCLFISAFITTRMVYQMHFVVEKPLPVYSEELICNSSEYTLDATAYWLGFRKVPIIGNYVGGLIIALLALALQAIVIYRQQHKRLVSGTNTPAHGLVFPEANPNDWDASMIDMIKFFLNFGFYKFGLELSMIMMVVVAWIRMDLLASLLLIWLMVFVFSSRVTCRYLWPVFLLYLAVVFPLQYAFYVGLPPSLCFDYPWSRWLSNPLQNDNLIFWLDLPSYRFELNANKSVADFLLLLMVACQEYAFRSESNSPAGDNESIYANSACCDLKRDNPTYDFIAKRRSCVDFLKIIVFMYGHWITIVMVLVAGLGGLSLFALGYIILAFWILWQGTSLYVMPDYRKTLGRWNLLLYYTVFVMFCKILLQVFACIFVHMLIETNLCCIRQLFSIVCVSLIPGRINNYYLPSEQQEFDRKCGVQKSETQIGFDTFAFGLLVLQLRIFNSWYFQHCVVEYRSEAVLMNRGAVLQDQLIEREMIEQKKQQEKKFKNIKMRTDQIRKDCEKRLSKVGAFVSQTYGQAKRAGDYYMFEYDPSEDALDELVETSVPEVTPGASDFNKLDPAQLMHTAMQHDLDLVQTLDAVNSAERIEIDEEKRMIKAVSDEMKSSQRETALMELYIDEEPKSDGQIVAGSRFLQKMFISTLGWFAAFLNRRSREHRYVAYVLGKEKEKLKERLKQPLVDASRSVLDVRHEFNQQNLCCITSEKDIERLESEVENRWQQWNVFSRFLTAVGYCIAAHTDVICYLLAIINHARCAGIISLPLPLLIFFWGSLTNPRPTEIFWIIMITYTELVVVIKFIAQFGFFSFNSTANIIKAANSIDYVPGILGIRKTDYYAFWDIALLVALFFHRYMLRRLGLWKETDDKFRSSVPLVQINNPANANLSSASQTIADLDIAPATKEVMHINRIKNFFNMLFNPTIRYIKDLYPFMFLMDVLCFFVVSFGFSSFDYSGTGSVVRDISSNRVPITFVLMLIVISLMIIIDRAFYLRKAVKCKFLYQLIIVVFLHVWIFFVLPQITYKPPWLNKTAQFLYFIKCIYLLISAWQIRNGYPTLCAGNLITHAYGLANMVFFKLFMAVPFLFELRTVTDWTWADTSMPLFDFFNMENFYAIIYNLKCARTYERNFPTPRGVAKGAVIKYLMGVPIILGLILFIWLPLLSFSLLNRIGIVLSPNNVILTIGIEGYPSMFTIEAQGTELEFLTDAEYFKLQNAFSEHYASSDTESILRARHAVAFIREYNPENILKVRFRPESHVPWLISSDAMVAMKYELKEGTKNLNAIVKFTYERPSNKHSDYPTQHFYALTIPLPVNSTVRIELVKILDGQYNHSILLQNVWPPYVVMPNEGNVKPASSLLHVISGSNTKPWEAFSNISMELKTTHTAENKIWCATLIQSNETAALTLPLEDIKYEIRPEKYLQMVAFVDRVFPSFVSKYVQGGIIAMYLAVVMLVGRMIRGLVMNAGVEVMVSEIPNPDHLLKICLDIYLVREAKDFVLEQDLYGKLIFLFRSPENLIKWTRNKFKID
ncbi:Piezo-type mechanosensitive ion channel component [Dirofilaria immitis]